MITVGSVAMKRLMRRLATAMLLVGLVPVEARGEGSGSTQSMGADLWRVQSGDASAERA